MDNMYPFQREAVQFIERAGGNAFVGDDPGTGKTIIALGYCYNHPTIKRVLIVAPTVVVYKWKAEIARWLDKTGNVVDTTKTPITKDPFQIMSYTMMRLRAEELAALAWDLIVFDEAHHLKDRLALQTKMARRISKRSKRRLMLSGKPFLNQPTELFNPCNIMNPVVFSWPRFWMRFFYNTGFGWSVKAGAQEALKAFLTPHIIRRTKKDVLTELPDLQRVMLPFRLEKDDRDEYDNAMVLARCEPNVLVAANRLRQAVGKAKMIVAGEWVKNFLEENPKEKVVVYAHHLAVMRYLADLLQVEGVSVIDGSVPAKERAERAGKFQDSQYPRVMVIDMAASEGIDLFKASNILFAEREWVPNLEEQAESRLHRNGQKNAVVAYYLEAMDTYDEHLADVIERKRAAFNELMPSDDVDTVVKEIMEWVRRK